MTVDVANELCFEPWELESDIQTRAKLIAGWAGRGSQRNPTTIGGSVKFPVAPSQEPSAMRFRYFAASSRSDNPVSSSKRAKLVSWSARLCQ
jgi:hypothetical protein